MALVHEKTVDLIETAACAYNTLRIVILSEAKNL